MLWAHAGLGFDLIGASSFLSVKWDDLQNHPFATGLVAKATKGLPSPSQSNGGGRHQTNNQRMGFWGGQEPRGEPQVRGTPERPRGWPMRPVGGEAPGRKEEPGRLRGRTREPEKPSRQTGLQDRAGAQNSRTRPDPEPRVSRLEGRLSQGAPFWSHGGLQGRGRGGQGGVHTSEAWEQTVQTPSPRPPFAAEAPAPLLRRRAGLLQTRIKGTDSFPLEKGMAAVTATVTEQMCTLLHLVEKEFTPPCHCLLCGWGSAAHPARPSVLPSRDLVSQAAPCLAAQGWDPCPCCCAGSLRTRSLIRSLIQRRSLGPTASRTLGQAAAVVG